MLVQLMLLFGIYAVDRLDVARTGGNGRSCGRHRCARSSGFPGGSSWDKLPARYIGVIATGSRLAQSSSRWPEFNHFGNAWSDKKKK
jgi:hypothetical protein